jgi:hypothetical protein
LQHMVRTCRRTIRLLKLIAKQPLQATRTPQNIEHHNATRLCHCLLQYALFLPFGSPNPFAFAVFGKDYRCFPVVSPLLNSAFARALWVIAALCSFLVYLHIFTRKISSLQFKIWQRESLPSDCLLSGRTSLFSAAPETC